LARESTITQEQVNAAAERFQSSGIRPTNRAIREALGSGSMATIVKYLRAWRAGQPQQCESPVVLPLALQRVLVDFLGQEVAVAKAGIENELAIAEQTSTDLILESERQATALEVQEKEIERLRADNATLQGRLAQLVNEIEATQSALETQRQAAETARTEVARHEVRLEELPKLKQEIERLQVALEKERAGRASAEQAAAISTARLEKTEGQVAHLENQLVRANEDTHNRTKEGANGLARPLD